MENSKGWFGSWRQRDGMNARNAQSLDGVDSESFAGLVGSSSRLSLFACGGRLMNILEMSLVGKAAIGQCFFESGYVLGPLCKAGKGVDTSSPRIENTAHIRSTVITP